MKTEAKERGPSGSPHAFRLEAAPGAMFLGVDLARLLAIHDVGMRPAAAVADEVADGRTVSLQMPSIGDTALFEEKAAAAGVAATRLHAPEIED